MYPQGEQEEERVQCQRTLLAKKSKPAPKEDKDPKNQLEKARLEGMREGLEKREASLSSSQGSSKQGGGRGRGRGKG